MPLRHRPPYIFRDPPHPVLGTAVGEEACVRFARRREVNADNGPSDVPQEPTRTQEFASICKAETQRVKSDQKSSAVGALWDRVGIVEIFETWFFNIPNLSLFGRPNSCSTHYMNILGQGAGVTLIFNFHLKGSDEKMRLAI